MRNKAIFIFVLLVFFAAFSVKAEQESSQESGDQSEEQKVPIKGPKVRGTAIAEEVVVTATRTEHPLSDSPMPMDFVSGDQIEKSGAKDAGDAIAQLPGIYIDDYEPASHGGPGTGVYLLGLPTDRVLVLIDGQRVPQAMRAPDLEMIPVYMIDHIEVVKGPNSALYGSDAIAGVINIITRNPTDKMTLEGTLGYGSFNTYQGNILNGYKPKSFGYMAGFERVASDGWMDEYTQKNIVKMGIGPTEKFKDIKNDKLHPFETNDAIAKLSYDAGGILSWHGNIRYHWEDNHWGDEDKGFVTDYKTSLDTQTGFGFNAGSAGKFDLTGYYFRRTFRFRQLESIYVYDFFEPDQIDQYYSNNGNETIGDNYRVELTHTVAPAKWNLLTWGAGARFETLNYKAFEFTENITNDNSGYIAGQTILSAFIQDEMFFFNDRFSVVPGVRLDHHDRWGAVVNPKLSMLGKVVLTEPYRLSLRLSGGRAFKEPTLSELYRPEFRHTGYYLKGNPDLQPEKAWGGNFEIEQGFSKIAILKTGMFFYSLEDMIWTAIVNPTYTSGFPLMTYVNLKNVRVAGAEASADIHPTSWLTLSSNYTYTNSKVLQDDKTHAYRKLSNDEQQHEGLGTVPEHQVNGIVGFDSESWQFGAQLMASYFSKRDFIGMGGLWYTADPMVVTKARIYKRFLNHMELFLEADNLINYTWDREGDGDNDMPPFNLFGGVKLWL